MYRNSMPLTNPYHRTLIVPQSNACVLLVALTIALLPGCGGSENSRKSADANSAPPKAAPATTPPPAAPPPIDEPRPAIRARSVLGNRNRTENSNSSLNSSSANETTANSDEPQLPARTFADLLRNDPQGSFESRPMTIDRERVAAAGIRVVAGKHLELFSDLPNQDQLQELVTIFDAAVPLWCEIWQVPLEKVTDWKVSGFLIGDAEKMRLAGLLPEDLPPFPNGYFRGFEFWFNDQPSDFYRRCLMLHEGNHAFMYHHLGGTGPPWYFEGMAERTAVHSWDGSQLKLDVRLKSRDEAPLWGRVKILADAFESGTIYLPEVIMRMDNEEFRRTESYAWAWGACEFFGRHPAHAERFAQLRTRVADRSPAFASTLVEPMAERWEEVLEDWQLFLGEVDYGYDVERAAVLHRPAVEFTGKAFEVEILADRGWQAAGLQVPAGTYRISAEGRFDVRTGAETWTAEPDGITIDYYRGQPLGKLLVALRGDEKLTEVYTPLLVPTDVGRERLIRFDRPGQIFFRLNDAPNSLDDNRGSVRVTIEPAP